MNSIERLQKLSGITIVEGATYSPSKKYAGCDKAELEKAKKELTAVVADTANSSFKSKNAQEELKAVNAALAALADADKPAEDVKEGNTDIAAIVEAKDEDDDKEDDKDSDKKDDKESDEDKPAFLKKKDDNEDDKDSDDKEDDESEKKDDKEDDKDSDKKDDDCKCDESVDEIAAKILAPEVEAIVETPIVEASNAFDVFLNGKKIDTVHNTSDDASEVKRSLIDHDGYDSGISVKKAGKKTVEESTAEQIAAKIIEADLTPQEIKVDYQNGPEENSGIKKEEGDKIRVPANVKKDTKQRISELKSAIERYDDKGYNDKSIKQQAVDCLEQILENLSAGNVESVKQAQIYFGTLMSPLTDFFPPTLINFLAHALNPNAAHPNTK